MSRASAPSIIGVAYTRARESTAPERNDVRAGTLARTRGWRKSCSVKLKTARGLVAALKHSGRLIRNSALIKSASLGIAPASMCAAKRYPRILVTDPDAHGAGVRSMRELDAETVVVTERDADGGIRHPQQARQLCAEHEVTGRRELHDLGSTCRSRCSRPHHFGGSHAPGSGRPHRGPAPHRRPSDSSSHFIVHRLTIARWIPVQPSRSEYAAARPAIMVCLISTLSPVSPFRRQ